MAWNFTLNATQAVPNFDVDAPVIRLSWADAGSGVFARLVTALVLGLITDRHEPAHRVVGAAGIAGLAATALDLLVL
jgi:cation transporter-like permease